MKPRDAIQHVWGTPGIDGRERRWFVPRHVSSFIGQEPQLYGVLVAPDGAEHRTFAVKDLVDGWIPYAIRTPGGE